MKFISLGLIATILFSSIGFSAPENVYGSGDTFIDVILSESRDEVSFKECSVVDPTDCKRIGNQDSYIISELVSQRNIEKWQVAGSAVADVALILTAGIGGLTASLFAINTTVVTGSSGAMAVYTGVGLGVGAASVAVTVVDALNPYEQYKQVETVSDKVLKDENVFIKGKASTFAQRLATVLEKIEQ